MRDRTCRAGVSVLAAACIGCLMAPAGWAQLAPDSVTVEQAVTEALSKNLGLLAERANISIAEAAVLTARLRPNPVVSAAGDHMDILGTGFNDVNGGGPTEIVMSSEFLLERGGKRQRRTEVAERTRTVVEAAFLDAVRTTTLEVQSAFVDVLLARDSLALVRENLDAFNRIVEINAVRVKAGDIAEVELIRSRVAALQYANSARRAELDLRNATTRLRTLLGRTALSAPVEAVGEMRRGPVGSSLAELRKTALDSRPDLGAFRRDVERAAAELRLQTAQAKPDFALGVEYRRQQVNASSNSLTVSVSAPLPLFDRNQGEIARAGHEQRQAEIRVRALEVEITGEVESAYNELTTARELVETIEQRLLGESRDVREITDFSYQRGEATLLELLDAQRAFNETMQAYNEAKAEFARSLYRLDAVCGRMVTQ